MILEPGFQVFHFGSERELTMWFPPGARPRGFPAPEDLPAPGCEWRDLADKVREPYTGEYLNPRMS